MVLVVWGSSGSLAGACSMREYEVLQVYSYVGRKLEIGLYIGRSDEGIASQMTAMNIICTKAMNKWKKSNPEGIMMNEMRK